MSEQINRLRWKCRRGMRELDLLFKGFSEKDMLDLTLEDNAIFNAILDYDDQTPVSYTHLTLPTIYSV